jgi:hypothetical protein
VRVMRRKSEREGRVLDGRGAGRRRRRSSARRVVGLGGAVPGRKHVALRLVATPRWHKGSNLNVQLIVFFSFYNKKFFYWDLSPYLILSSHTRLGLNILISLLRLGSGGGTRVPVGYWIIFFFVTKKELYYMIGGYINTLPLDLRVHFKSPYM